jgi:hypothetical protein
MNAPDKRRKRRTGNGPHDLRMTRMNHLNNEMISVGTCIKIVSGLRGIQGRLIPRQAHNNTLVAWRRDREQVRSVTWLWRRAGSRTPLTPRGSYAGKSAQGGRVKCETPPETAILSWQWDPEASQRGSRSA